MKFTIERNWIDVVGRDWMPGCISATRYDLSAHDVANIGKPTRANIEQWLTSHSGDFQQVLDFHTVIGECEYDWQTPEGECQFIDCMYPEGE